MSRSATHADAIALTATEVRNNPAALEQLRRRLLAFARREMMDAAAAEDVTQETLLALWAAPGRYRGDAPYVTFALSVLKNKMVDVYRSQGRETAVADDTLELLRERAAAFDSAPAADAGEMLDEQRFRARFWPRLKECLADLPARSRATFWMHDVLGLDVGSVSKHLDVTVNHTSVMSHRARAHVRKRWMALEGGGALAA